MRTVEIRTIDGSPRLITTEQPDPGPPAAHQLRVRITASSVNYHDSLIARGLAPSPEGFVPMADAAGIVEAVGSEVSGFHAGDRVISRFFPTWHDGPNPPVAGFGTSPGIGLPGYARDIAIVPAQQVSHAPSNWTDAEAATLPVAGMTAWRALVVEGRIKPGDSVLVLGTGGVSVYGLQLAKHLGATVIATSSSDEKLARVKDLGADVTINYRTTPAWGDAVLEATQGLGVDHVIEIGGAGTLAQSIRAVRPGGQITLLGTLTGLSGEIPTGELNLKQAHLHGAIVGHRRQQDDLVRAIEAQDAFRPVIDRTYTLDELDEAIAFFATGQHFGKISVTF